MLQEAKTRALPLLNRVPDVTPAAQACCGVCRSCTTTNVVTVGAAVLAGAGIHLVRLGKRLVRKA